jgi:hypothetical protein
MPRRGGGRGAANRLWITQTGQQVPLASGTEDLWHAAAQEHAGALPPTLRRAHRLAHHIEVKFAMRMRQERLSEETIVIDRRVCGTRADSRTLTYTCDKMLKWFLPAGARLRVVEPDGTIRTYQGRGTP